MKESEQLQFDEFRASIDSETFTTDSYMRRIDKPWGWEIHFTPDNLPYMGKILHVNEDSRISLQSHDVKQESWMLTNGKMTLIIENPNGEMDEVDMEEGVGYTCALGQKHRLKGGEGGGEVFEVSTPELGNTFRLEDDYNRSTETEEDRAERNQTAKSQFN